MQCYATALKGAAAFGVCQLGTPIGAHRGRGGDRIVGFKEDYGPEFARPACLLSQGTWSNFAGGQKQTTWTCSRTDATATSRCWWSSSRRSPAPTGTPSNGALCPRDEVGGDPFFVELVAEARGRRRDDVAVLPDDRVFQDLAVELGEGLDALLDQEVGRAHVDVDRRRGRERPRST